MFHFLQALFLWILFYSYPLKSLTKYLPCALSCYGFASPSCFCPAVVCLPILSQLHSQLQELSACEHKQPPTVCCFCWVAPSASVHLHGSLRQDSSSSAPALLHIHSSHSPSWSELWVWRVSAGATKLSMSHCVFLASERAVGNKREGKSSQETKEVFPGEVWKEIGSQ